MSITFLAFTKKQLCVSSVSTGKAIFCRSKEKPNPLKVISKHEILVYSELSLDVPITS